MFKNTAQSKFIKEYIFQSKKHPTAEEIFQEASRKLPYITRATVYNVLNRLVKAGYIRELNIKKGATVYEGNLIPHAHLYCTSCERITDIELPEFSAFFNKIKERYEANAVDLIISGVCDECKLKRKE